MVFMSKIVFDFLMDSKLSYPEYVTNDYSGLSEKELKNELNNYRNHLASHLQEHMEEVKNNNQISVAIESFGELPDEELYKQLVMYVDKIIVNDPIYQYTGIERDDYSLALNELMKTQSKNEINRKKLSNAVKYMLSSKALVSTNILKFFPIKLLHRYNEGIPIYYSKNNFADAVPKEYKAFFLERARVTNIKNNIIDFSVPLELGRNIYVDFEGSPMPRGMGYILLETQFEKTDKRTDQYTTISHIPNELPTQATFDLWVTQSINKAAGKIFQETFSEILLAQQFGSMYLTQNSFTAGLLSIPFIPIEQLETDLANIVLNLDLPVINNIALDELLEIRSNDGQAFENFRMSLRSKLKNLRLIDDPIILKKSIENLKHELLEVEIHSVNKAFQDIKRKIGNDTAIFFGSLVSSYSTGGLTLVGAAAALLKGSIDFSNYLSKVKENNGYFLWKVKRASRK